MADWPGLLRLLLAVCWVLAVGLVMHALVQDIQRVLSLAGALRIHYPPAQWVTVNRHQADVQDLAFNETWFLAEGILWGVIGWIALGQLPGPALVGWHRARRDRGAHAGGDARCPTASSAGWSFSEPCSGRGVIRGSRSGALC